MSKALQSGRGAEVERLVKRDLHAFGKNLVIMMLKDTGFEVVG